MIKILHTGDIHLGDLAGPTKDGENLRRLDTLRCMEAVYHEAFLAEPDVTIIAGDLFNRSRVWADTALDDVNDALEQFIRPICKCSGAVVLLFGTMNHDNPRAFEVIRKATADLKNLHIYTEPKVETISTGGGPVQIMAVPGFDKARLRLFCPGADKETENRNATALVNDIILGLSTELDRSIPSILTAHYTVSGSEADNGSTFLAGQDVVVLPATIDAAGVTLGCFGHIHKPQRLACNTPAYYCGSPNQLTFNDEGTEHGFYIHEIDQGRVVSTFKRTPEREHLTVRLNSQQVADFISTGSFRMPANLEGRIIRVRYSCTAEQEKAFNRAELQKQIVAAGAFHVAEIFPEDVEALDAKDQLTEHDGPAECLARWLDTNEITGEKAARLLELAAPIIKQADDGREDSKHTGAFMPKVIEVKNYRSYTEASFDFEPVHMAMVNGQNGVGKSSLFMDAIADCLYEQTRKEDIGGWVRDGTKSGSISFTFGMGGQDYRVIRTRTKSGRGTLALQRWNQDAQAWADESDTTMKLTQAKIERLLGMDCNTFCSIALIRQDAYGLFLDADSDRRMEVLSALLGLDIYGRMEDIAKAAATEQRRKIAALKERINVLGEQISAKDDLLDNDMVLSEEIDQLNHEIEVGEADLRALESAEALLKEVLRQASEKEAQSLEYDRERDRKAQEREELELKYSNALHMKNGLSAAQEATERLAAARAKLQELAPQVERDKELLKEKARLEKAIGSAEADLVDLRWKQRQYEAILSRKAEIEVAQAAIEALVSQKEDAHARLMRAYETEKAMNEAKAAVDQHVADSRVRIADLQSRLKAAQAEAEKLADSGCPIPGEATCKFLTSAIAAHAAIPDLSSVLEQTKAEDRQRYEDLMKVYNEAKAADEAMGDPAAELSELDREERKHRELADQTPRLAAAEAKVEEIAASIQAAEKTIQDAKKRSLEIDAERAALGLAVMEYQRAQQTIEIEEPIAAHLADCQAAGATADALAPQLERLRSEIDDLTNKVLAAHQEAEEIRQRAPKAQGNPEGLRAILNSRRKKVTDRATRRGTIKAKLDAISEAEVQTAQLRREVEEAAASLNDYTTLVQAFGLDGIQYMIIRGVVPEIMRQSNDILAAMTGGRMAVDIRTEREQKSTKQIVNSLEVWINTLAGGTRPYQSHSGGEKVKIALAVTLGLADVKARRAGVQLGMLFIDEPPFLDADGTDAYADALLNMATRNPNMRILAISHDPTMKARFNQNIVVTAGEDGSVVAIE